MRRPRVGLGDRVRAAGDRVLADDLVEALGLAVGPQRPLAREHAQAADGEQHVGGALLQVEADRALVEHHRALHAGQRGAAGPATAYLPDIDSKLYFTSAAVTGSPLVKRAFGFSRKLIDDLSGATASPRRAGRTSSAARRRDSTASDSNMKMPRPAGALPLVVKGLNLSKLVRRSGLRRLMRAALGRVRVDVVEVREAARVLRLAEGGVGVHPRSVQRRVIRRRQDDRVVRRRRVPTPPSATTRDKPEQPQTGSHHPSRCGSSTWRACYAKVGSTRQRVRACGLSRLALFHLPAIGDGGFAPNHGVSPPEP